MRKLLLSIIVCMAYLSLAIAGHSDLEKIYSEAMQNIEKQAADAYVGGLDALEEQMVAAGRPREVLDLRNEKERFHRDGDIAIGLANQNRSIVELAGKLSATRDERQKALIEAYIPRLEERVKELTKQDRLKEAIAAEERLETIKAKLPETKRIQPNPSERSAAVVEDTRPDALVAKNDKWKKIMEWAEVNAQERGEVVYQFEKGLSHDLKEFPDSREMHKNRKDVIPPFEFEPKRGRILSSEIQNHADRLTVQVKGKALIYACQVFRGPPQHLNLVIKLFEARGWTILGQYGASPQLGFIAVRPFSDESYTFEIPGNRRQLPATLIFSACDRDSRLSVREKRR